VTRTDTRSLQPHHVLAGRVGSLPGPDTGKNKDMVVDEEPTNIRVSGKFVDAHTEQLEDPLVPYLEKLMEDSQLPPRCYPRHGPFHCYLWSADLEKIPCKFQHSPPIISSPGSVRAMGSQYDLDWFIFPHL
jgi:hypothetical protein